MPYSNAPSLVEAAAPVGSAGAEDCAAAVSFSCTCCPPCCYAAAACAEFSIRFDVRLRFTGRYRTVWLLLESLTAIPFSEKPLLLLLLLMLLLPVVPGVLLPLPLDFAGLGWCL